MADNGLLAHETTTKEGTGVFSWPVDHIWHPKSGLTTNERSDGLMDHGRSQPFHQIWNKERWTTKLLVKDPMLKSYDFGPPPWLTKLKITTAIHIHDKLHHLAGTTTAIGVVVYHHKLYHHGSYLWWFITNNHHNSYSPTPYQLFTNTC